MRNLIVISLTALALVGCNLFGETEPGGTHPDAGEADVGDGGPVSTDSENTDGVDPSDTRPPPVDGCQPPSDVELCMANGIECGELIVRATDGVIERHAAIDLGSSTCGERMGMLNGCNSSSGPDLTFEAPTSGDYLVRLHAWASQAGSGTILSKVRLTGDGETIREFAVTGTEENVGTYDVVVPLDTGSHIFTWRLANDYYDSSLPEDRNIYFDWVEVEGPMVAPVDECGLTRGGVQCGGCPDSEACGFDQVGMCSCSCTNMDGTCAPTGLQPGNPCAECVAGQGWTNVDGNCDDGDACTVDSCDPRRAVCVNPSMSCGGDACEGGTCVDGTCEFTRVADGSDCGTGGVCTAGLCACPDGTDLERQCADGEDGDCDGLTDCEDPDCEGRNCGPGGVTCVMTVCQ